MSLHAWPAQMPTCADGPSPPPAPSLQCLKQFCDACNPTGNCRKCKVSWASSRGMNDRRRNRVHCTAHMLNPSCLRLPAHRRTGVRLPAALGCTRPTCPLPSHPLALQAGYELDGRGGCRVICPLNVSSLAQHLACASGCRTRRAFVAAPLPPGQPCQPAANDQSLAQQCPPPPSALGRPINPAGCLLPLQNCAVCPGNRVCQTCKPGYQFLSATNRSQCVPLCFVPNCGR